MNVDGAHSVIYCSTACGGLLRDAEGHFLRGFVYKLEDGDALHAELWACLHGLKLAWDAGSRRVILESDSSTALELLATEQDAHHYDFGVLKEIQRMLGWDWEVKMQFVSRNNNRAADLLAKEGLKALPGFHFLASAPEVLKPVLDYDCSMLHGRSRLM